MSARKRKSTTLTDGESVAQFINTKPTKKPKEYIIDHIVSKRTRKGGREFLIHWEGYGPESDSWEPEANLQPELVSEFLIAEEQFKAQPRTTRGVRKSVDIPATTLTPSKTKRARSNKSDTTDGETPTKQRRTRTPSRTRRPSLSPPRHTTTTTADQGTLLSPTRGTARAANAKKKVVREEEELTITKDYRPPSLLHSRPTTTTRTYERTTITTATRSPTTSYTTTSNAVAKAITPPNKSAVASTSTSSAASTITSPLQVHAGMLVPSLLASATIATLIHLVIGVSMSPGVAKTVLGHLEKVASKSISNAILDRIQYHDVKLLIAITVPLFVIMHLITRMKSRSIHQTDYTVGVVTTDGIPDTHWTSPKYNHRADTWAAEMIRAIYAFITIVAVLLFWNKEPTWASKQHMEPAFFAITASFAIIDILINHSNMRVPRLIHSLITAAVTTYLTTHTSAVDPVLYQHLFYTFLLIVLAEAERAGSVAFGGLLYPMTSYIYQLLYVVGTPLLGAYFYSSHDGKKPVEASMATAVLVTQAFTSIMDQYLTQPKKVNA